MTKPVIKIATPATRIADVRYEVLENPALTDEQVGLYLPYKPQAGSFFPRPENTRQSWLS